MPKRSTTNKMVVEGTEQGSVFPMNREELLKESVLDGAKEPFDLHGGVYATNLKAIGSGVVRGPVLARDNVTLESSGEGGPLRFLSGIAAGNSMFAQFLGEASVTKNLTADIDRLGFVVRGDIISNVKVKLQNCLVVGSISAPSVHIENCIVFGSISTEDSPGEFRATCSCFGMFYAKWVTLEGPNTLTVVGGVSEHEPNFEEYLDSSGVKLPATMRLLSLCRHNGSGCGLTNKPPEAREGAKDNWEAPDHLLGKLGGVACSYWIEGACPHQDRISLYQSDFVQMTLDVQRQGDGSYVANPLNEEDGSIEGLRSGGKVVKWIFGLHSRAVKLGSISDENKTFQDILHAIFAFEYLSAARKEILRNDLLMLSRDEIQLLPQAIEGL